MNEIGLYSPEEQIALLETAQVFNFDEALEAVQEYLSFSKPWHTRCCLLWGAQVPLAKILPDHLVLLGFSGPKSSGKSEATRLVVEMVGGRYISGGTPATFIRAFNEYPAVGIDELDANVRRLPDLEAMLRSASDRNAVYQTSVPSKQKGRWESLDVRVGVPVAFSYRSQVEDAVLSRTVNIEMPRKDDSGLVLRNLLGGNPPRHAIGDWMMREAADRLKAWSALRVREHMLDPEFRARLDALPAVMGRQKQIGACFLVISDVMEWDLEDAIQDALRAKQDDEEANEDVKEVLRSLLQGHPRGYRIGVSEALYAVNEQRKHDGVSRFTYPRFAKVRREWFERGLNDRKDSRKGGKRFLYLDEASERTLGLEDGS
ncbi:MAG: hypothetical protein LN413_01085 [Candidatus Thermoplasmatota archaeon]|nr:hypothetical protein [Candidatus Thermoplasmatota archaeon]